MQYLLNKEQYTLLEDKTWSISSLKTFKACPYSFYRTYCLKDRRNPPNTFFGSAFHQYQEDYANRKHPDANKIFKEFEVSFFDKGMWNYCLDNGRKFIETQVFPFEFRPEEKLIEEIYGKKFIFIIDLLVFRNDKIYLYDYKTSKNANYADDHRYQMAFYKYIVSKKYPEKEIIVNLFFPKVNKTILLEKLKFDLRSYFKDVNTILETKNFQPTIHKFCDWCAYKKSGDCPKHN